MKKYAGNIRAGFLLLLAIVSISAATAQELKPGFDPDEYLEIVDRYFAGRAAAPSQLHRQGGEA